MKEKYSPRNNTPSFPRRKRLVGVREALAFVLGRYPREERLVRLWQNWNMVMGETLAATARPLGRRKTTLLVGGEDALVMQELSLQREEILERANAFMDEKFFSDVHINLLCGKQTLDAPLPPPSRARPPQSPPNISGVAFANMPDSPVTRCYAAFAALAAQMDEGEENLL